MKKFTTTILSLCALTVGALLTATGFCAQKTTATAQTPEQSEWLIAPSSYEEYLTLNKPTDATATDGYIAVADGNTLYIFNRDREIWQSYTHANPITRVLFGGRDRLFFLDGQSNSLLELNANAPASGATETGIYCSTFAIHGETLYYINFSAGYTYIYHAPLSDLSNRSTPHTEQTYSPALTYCNEEIYFVYGTEVLYKINKDTEVSEYIAQLPKGVRSMIIVEETVFCTTSDGGFYGYALADLYATRNAGECTPVAYYDDGYATLSAHGTEIYLTRGNAIRKYSLTDKALTDYEIGGASDSKHRFNGASETLLSGDTLFIADDNNDRISVYGLTEQAFLPSLPCALNTPYMAAYGETLLVASGSQAVLYGVGEKDYGNTLYQLSADKISGAIVGAAAIYGNYYILTDTNYCYTLTATAEGYAYTETLRSARMANTLTADAHGFLYILNDGAVYRYTEDTFNAPTEQGQLLCDNLPAGVTELSVDYAGNLYALANNALHIYETDGNGQYTKRSETPFTTSFVYGIEPKAISFTFGIEENEAYILYEGNYLTATSALALPTIKNIPTQGAAEEIFNAEQADYSITEVQQGSLLVEIDLTALEGATQFPYLRYYRNDQPITGVKIGETDAYALVCYRENAASPYKAFLVAKARQTAIEATTPNFEPKLGYLTNQTQAYKFPSMGLPSFGSFAKNQEVTLLDEVNGLDGGYYIVELEGKRVFLPKACVTLFDGAPPISEEIILGEPKADTDAMLRLAYILLGAGAICILVDYLILRKKDKDD